MYSPRQAEIKRRVEEIRGTTTPTNPTDAAITRAKAKIRQREQAARLRRNPIAQKAQEEMERLRARRLERDPVRRAAQSALDKLHDRRMARDPAYRAYQRAKDRLNPAAAKAREQRRKEQRQGQKKAKSKNKKTPKKDPKTKKPQKPTSITVKGAISSDVVIRHVPIGYIPDHELQRIADIEVGHLPEGYPRNALTPAQIQDHKDEIEDTYRKALATYEDKIATITQNEKRIAKDSAEVIELANSDIKQLTNDIAGYHDQIDDLRARSTQITTTIEDTKAEIEHEKTRPAHEIPEDTIVDIDTIAREYNLTIDPDHDPITDTRKTLASLYNDLADEEDRLRGAAPRDELEKLTNDLDILDEVLDVLEAEEKRAPHQGNSDRIEELTAQVTRLQQTHEEAEETQKDLTQKIDESEEQINIKKGIISAHQTMIDEGNIEARSNAADRLHEAEEEREAALSNLEKDQQRAEQADADTIEELKRNLVRTVDEIVNKYYFEGNIFS